MRAQGEAMASSLGLSRLGRPSLSQSNLGRNPFLPGQRPSHKLEVTWPFYSMLACFSPFLSQYNKETSPDCLSFETHWSVASNLPFCHLSWVIFNMMSTNWTNGPVVLLVHDWVADFCHATSLWEPRFFSASRFLWVHCSSILPCRVMVASTVQCTKKQNHQPSRSSEGTMVHDCGSSRWLYAHPHPDC